MLDGCVDLSNLIDPIIDLEDLGHELKPSQLAKVFNTCMQNLDDVKEFVEALTDCDFNWLDQAVSSDFRV